MYIANYATRCSSILATLTNMRFHLQLTHRPQYLQLQQSKVADQPSTSSQKTVCELFHQASPLDKSAPRWNELTQSICYFIAKDMHPVSTINDPGFGTMLKKFEPRYIPPDRKTLSNNYLPQMFRTETACGRTPQTCPFLFMHY